MTKDKTISFRVNEESFENLQSVAEDQDLSLSVVFREYVEEIIKHDGRVEVVPEYDARKEGSNLSNSYPSTVEVPTNFVREYERLELECKHLREQLKDYKQYSRTLGTEIESHAMADSEMVRLEEVDFEAGTSILVE